MTATDHRTSTRYYESPDTVTASSDALMLLGGIVNCPDWQFTASGPILGLNQAVKVINPRRNLAPGPAAHHAQLNWEQAAIRTVRFAMFWFPYSGRTEQAGALAELGQFIGGIRMRDTVIGVDPRYIRDHYVRSLVGHAAPLKPVYTTLPDTIQATLDMLTAKGIR